MEDGEHLHLLPNRPVRWEVGPSLPSFFFTFFFPPSKSPSCLFLLFPVLIYNLPETVDSHSLTAKRVRRGAGGNQGAATHKENSQGGAACTNPIDVTYRLG